MPIHLRSTLQATGATSVRDLFSKTGSAETSLYRQGQIATIDLLHRKTGGIRGPLGFPLKEVEFNGLHATRHFAGGPIHFLNNAQGPGETWAVDIRYLGFKCVSESDWDQSSGSDEPYLLVGVVGTQGSKVVKFGPYASIDSGTVRYEASQVLSALGDNGPRISPPLVLGVAVMEHDFGSTEEATKLVRDVLKEVEGKVDQAAAAFMGASTSNHVMPEWLRDIFIGWVPELGTALLGMADDEVGKMPLVLFDYKPEGGQWTTPPEVGTFGMNKYTHMLPVDGGSEGSYEVYFHVRLWKTPAPISPIA